MSCVEIIEKKKNGGALTFEELSFFVQGYTRGEIPDYQAAALMMAIYFRGMSAQETVWLTQLMAASGDQLDLSRFGERSADKHSTGGVGDKTTLIVAPIVAACGGTVAKMSGRGLGHTGGTVDKLAAIPGYRTDLSVEEFLKQAEEIGLAVVGQSGNLTPADKKLYALRDVTATVDSIPLITASIMSKKLAAGAKNLVLDVKVGSGAFMKTLDDARTLARAMIEIGVACGRRVTAVLSDMASPLGAAVGNALEVQEAAAVLRTGTGGSLRTLCLTLAGEMLALSLGLSQKEALSRAERALDSGAAFEKMQQWVAAQGGDVRALTERAHMKSAAFSLEVSGERDGFIAAVDAAALGRVSVLLGAGREHKEDEIDFAAGLVLQKNRGDPVAAGQTLCTLYTDRGQMLEQARAACLAAFEIGPRPPEDRPVVLEVLRA